MGVSGRGTMLKEDGEGGSDQWLGRCRGNCEEGCGRGAIHSRRWFSFWHLHRRGPVFLLLSLMPLRNVFLIVPPHLMGLALWRVVGGGVTHVVGAGGYEETHGVVSGFHVHSASAAWESDKV